MATRGFRFPIKERKFADVASIPMAMNTTGQFSLLACPVPGTDYTNRIGRKVVLRSVYIRGIATLEGAFNLPTPPMACAAQLGRAILLIDMQPNGAWCT